MYCEDVDLSLKARQLNRNIIYAPKSVILHNVSQSLGEHSSKKNFMKIKINLNSFGSMRQESINFYIYLLDIISFTISIYKMVIFKK